MAYETPEIFIITDKLRELIALIDDEDCRIVVLNG